MFQKQSELTSDAEKVIRRTCIFIIKFYIKTWFTAPVAVKAASNDLKLVQNLIRFEKIDKTISKTVISKLLRHLWYLSEDLIALALFDETGVTNVEKKKIVEAMRDRDRVGDYSKRHIMDEKDYKSLLTKNLSDFASKKSLFLFRQFGLSVDFFQLDPSHWAANSNYQSAREIFSNLEVLNDIAERSVSSVERTNQCLTQSEDQLQAILQVTQMHRKKYPESNKRIMSTMNPSDESWFI